jgi:hypothetical protein
MKTFQCKKIQGWQDNHRLIEAIQQESLELISHAKYHTKMITEQLESDFIENVKIHMQKCEIENNKIIESTIL